MADEQVERARRSYDRLSKVYSWLSDDSERKFVSEAVEQLLRPQPGEWILEPGFGTGQVLVVLAELVGAGGRVVGLDVSGGMVSQAGRRVAKHGVSERVTLECGDIAHAPFEDAVFDAVFMSFTLELFGDDEIPQVLAEVARVLRPDGRVCVASMSSTGGVAAMEKAYAWAHRHWPAFVDCRPIEAPALLSEAGFAVSEHTSMSMWGLAVDLTLARRGSL